MARPSARGERGQILILTALVMVVLLATAALSIDAAYMYDRRNIIHAATDAAAKSGAIERWRGPGNVAAFAMLALGSRLNVDPSTITPAPIIRACDDPAATCSTAFQANWHNYVEVIAGQDTSTFFGKILGWTQLTPTTRSVAGTSGSVNCLITLAPPGSMPPSLSIGNSTITMPGCNAAVGGDLETTNPNATIASGGTDVTGTCINGCPQGTTATIGAPPPTDPLGTLPAPPNPGGCTTQTVANNSSLTLPGNACYSQITLGNNSTLNFGPGIVYLTGSLSYGQAPNLNGTDVMIYLAGTQPLHLPCPPSGAVAGCISLLNMGTVNLSAPTSGPYTGILFFQDRANNYDADFGNNNTFNINGAFYFPSANVSFKNSIGTTNSCALFLAYSLVLDNGNGTLSNSCASFGGSPILTVTLAE